MIHASGVTRSRGGRVILHGIEIVAEAGEVVGLLGVNGAGKTSLLEILAGVHPADDGRILLGGHDLHQDPDATRRQLGFAPEHPPLSDELTVREHLTFVVDLRGVDRARVPTTLDTHGLREVADHPTSVLSQGWRRRVATACAMVHDPTVLLLDEPTTGLDPSARLALRRHVRDHADRGGTVLWSTHEIAEARAVCSRVVVLRDGRVVASVDLEGAGRQDVRVVTAVQDPAVGDALRAVPGVDTVARDGEGWVVHTGQDVRAAIARAAAPFDLLRLEPADALTHLVVGSEPTP